MKTNRVVQLLVYSTLATMLLTGCVGRSSVSVKPKDTLTDYCFPSTKLKATREATTPAAFLGQHPKVLAAINGVYWGADDSEPQGLVYITTDHLASKKGLISGYLVVKQDGTVSSGVALADKVYKHMETKNPETYAVIGTHPLLVTHGAVHEQALQPRYNLTDGIPKEEFRAALGSKQGTDLCFVVSTGAVTMNNWADDLVNHGYVDAINLDGGPVAQLAYRDGGETHVQGNGVVQTKLIFFTE